MKFKVLKGTAIFQELAVLKSKIQQCNSMASDVVKELGGKRFCASSYALAGGISAIEFDVQPDGYKKVGESWQSLYYPKAANKKDCKIIESLPLIDCDELNSIVSFKGPQTVSTENGLAWIRTPRVFFGDEVILIEFNENCKYEPVDGMIEITSSEFISIKEDILVKQQEIANQE